MTTQPDALQLAHDINLRVRYGHETEDQAKRRHQKHDKLAADELRRLHSVNQELLAALKVAALAIHEYRTQGAPCAYWDDVEYQAAEAIAKAERTTP